jgi:hypothetical protein
MPHVIKKLKAGKTAGAKVAIAATMTAGVISTVPKGGCVV